MRLTLILCLLTTSLTGLARAETTNEDRWAGWNELPRDTLGLSGDASVEALSRRLDRLIEDGDDQATIDRLLNAWLEQHASQAGAPSLQALLRARDAADPALELEEQQEQWQAGFDDLEADDNPTDEQSDITVPSPPRPE